MSGLNKTYVLDFDDLGSTRKGYGFLLKLKEHYPNFKCTCFTVPFSFGYFIKDVPIKRLKDWGKMIAEQDWLEIAVHGFAHLKGEWLLTDKKQIEIQIKAAENVFKKIGVDFVKVFKAPFWEYSKEVEEVLRDRGYVLAIDRNNPIVRTDIENYVFNWSIEEPMPKYHLLRGHGHMFGTPNGLDKCYTKLLKMPQDAKFMFISEYLCQKNTQQ